MTFEDVLEIKNGRNQRTVENPEGKYPIYGSGGIMGYADDYICDAQTVIVGRKGSINNPLYVEEPFWNVDTAFGLCANRDILLPRYLYYFCKKFDFERLNKTVTIPSLTKTDLLKIEIDLPSMEEQQKIVNRLVKTEQIIDLRRRELEELDNLIKSRFVEMFGDFIEKTVPVDFETICEFVTVGIANSATHSFCEDGVVMFRNQNIKEDHLDDSDIVHITPEFANKYKSKMLKKNDLLIVRTGYPGVACLVPAEYEGCQTFTTLIARVKNSKTIIPRFICHYINSEYGKNYVRDNSAGAAQQNFGATALSKLPVCLPPIEWQKEYIDFVEQVDKLKFIVRKVLEIIRCSHRLDVKYTYLGESYL